jgi:hypothetical protein
MWDKIIFLGALRLWPFLTFHILTVKTAKASGLAAEGHLILQGYLRPNTKP